MKRRILGIDPGTNVMGYGVLDVEGNHAEVVVLGTVQMNKVPDHYLRLKRIFDRTKSIIDEFLPDELAIEAPFFGKNVQSMLKLGRAQGICMAAALSHDIPVCEYAPMKIKMAITGNGASTKEQVAMMLQRMLKFSDIPKYLDATDALAVAYCHFLESNVRKLADSTSKGGVRIPTSSGRKTSWAEFLKDNPDRIHKK